MLKGLKMNANDINNYSVKTLIEWYITNLGENVEEARQNPTIMNIQKEIEKRLKDYEDDANIYGRRRRSR